METQRIPLDQEAAFQKVQARFPGGWIDNAIDPQPNRWGDFIFDVYSAEDDWRFIPRRVTVRRNGAISDRYLFSKWKPTANAANAVRFLIWLSAAATVYCGLFMLVSGFNHGEWKDMFAGIGIMVVGLAMAKLALPK
jgi:hypothetical protein